MGIAEGKFGKQEPTGWGDWCRGCSTTGIKMPVPPFEHHGHQDARATLKCSGHRGLFDELDAEAADVEAHALLDLGDEVAREVGQDALA